MRFAKQFIPGFLIGSTLMLSACNESTTGPKEWGGVIQMNDGGVPEEAFAYTMEDYQAMFRQEMAKYPALAKAAEDGMPPLTLEEFAALDAEVDYEVPDFDSIETEEELQALEKELGLSREEIVKNADAIRARRIAGRRFMLYERTVEYLGEKSDEFLGKSSFGIGDVVCGFLELTSDQAWMLFWNPTFIDGTFKASREAQAIAGWANNSDANRHALWVHLLADYNSHEVNYESEAARWGRLFANARETESTKCEISIGPIVPQFPDGKHPLDSPMDYHNNQWGSDYFMSVSRNRGKLNWWGYDSRWVETEPVATAKTKIYTSSLQAYKFYNPNELTSRRTSLVYFQ